MPFLRKGEILPIKGINLAIPSTYLPAGHAFPENMHYLRGEMKKRDGKSLFGDTAIGAAEILHLDTFQVSTGETRLIRHSRYCVEKYNTVTGLFEDITGAPLTGTLANMFSSAVVTEEDLYVFTNYADAIRKYNDAGVTAALGGASGVFKAKYVEYMTPYLFFANLEEGGTAIPTKGRWSDTGDPETYSGGNSGSKLFTDEPSEIRGVRKLKDFLFVYKERSAYRGTIVSTSNIFDFIFFGQTKGLYAPRTLVEANGGHFYMGVNDFHFNDAQRISDIGAPVREYIFNRLNREYYYTCHSLHVEEFKEVWFFITIVGQDWPTEVWKYKYDMDFWYRDTFANALSATNYKVITSLTWDDAVGTWNQQTVPWDDQSGQSDAPLQIIGDDKGLCYYRNPRKRTDNDAGYTSVLDTRDFTGIQIGEGQFTGLERDQEWLQLDLWAQGDSVEIYYSTDYGENWTFVETKELTEEVKKYTIYFDVLSEHIRFRFRNATAGEDFKIRSFIPYYLDSGEIENP